MLHRIKDYLLRDRVEDHRIDVIPGIRVLAIGLIAWFHIWQQSWLSPYIITKRRVYDFLALPRVGYLWVDMFILLSAFQLFLPHARAMMDGTQPPSTKDFYKKRARRILPSYYLSIVVCFFIAIFSLEFLDPLHMLRDLFSHLTFTHTFWPDTYLWTNLNVVLWTVGILVQFYLIFPLLANLFRKQPIPVFLIMVLGAFTFRHFLVNQNPDPAMYVNQLPAFLDVFALGMLTAYAYVLFNRQVTYQFFSPVSTVLSIISLILIYYLMKDLSFVSGHDTIQRWQGQNRFYIGILFSLFLFSTAYAMRWWRWLYANKVMIFLASISYNYYIWHQYIAVKLREWNIPPSQYPEPNVYGDRPWQYIYTACAFLTPLAFSILVTWLYDRKLIDLLSNKLKNADRSPEASEV